MNYQVEIHCVAQGHFNNTRYWSMAARRLSKGMNWWPLATGCSHAVSVVMYCEWLLSQSARSERGKCDLDQRSTWNRNGLLRKPFLRRDDEKLHPLLWSPSVFQGWSHKGFPTRLPEGGRGGSYRDRKTECHLNNHTQKHVVWAVHWKLIKCLMHIAVWMLLLSSCIT